MYLVCRLLLEKNSRRTPPSTPTLLPSAPSPPLFPYTTLFRSGGNTREHPVHLPVMRELEDDLVDHPPLADGPADRGDLRVGRHLGDEVPPVKLQQLLAAPAAGHGGHVVDVVVARHGGDRRGRVALRELAAHVPLPQLDQAPFVGGEGMVHGNTSFGQSLAATITASRSAAGAAARQAAVRGLMTNFTSQSSTCRRASSCVRLFLVFAGSNSR